MRTRYTVRLLGLVMALAAIGCDGESPALDGGEGDGGLSDGGLSDGGSPDAAMPDGGVPACTGGAIRCGGECVDPSTDARYCGASGSCEGANAGVACTGLMACSSGVCATTCAPDQIVCDDACVDPQTSATHCGASGSCEGAASGEACEAGEVCSAGACVTSCPTGQIACDGGCVDPDTSATYCGASGDCASDATDGETCAAGEVCGGGTCATHFTADADLAVDRFQGTCADGGDMVPYVVANIHLPTRTLQLATPVGVGCLAPGDQVLLHGSNGAYQLLTIESIVTSPAVAGLLTVTDAIDFDQEGPGTLTASSVMRVPTYGNVVVDAGANLTSSTGIFAAVVEGSIDVAGSIGMDGLGYQGGERTTLVNTTGLQGASRTATAVRSAEPNGGGGGGGTGQFTTAGCPPHGTAGGGGGNLQEGQPGTAACSGLGGLISARASRLSLGSGGGAGGADDILSDNPPGGRGGNGGGAVLLWADAVEVSGAITARGEAGEGDAASGCAGLSVTDCWDYSGPGGGGAGGSVILHGATYTGAAPDVSGGAGGLGNFAGNGGAGGLGVVVTLPRTCGEALRWDPTLTDGTHRIDPDGENGPLPAFDAYCDMTHGGWTLIAASNGVGPVSWTEDMTVLPGSASHLPFAVAQGLALASSRVHIRTAGAFDTESVTSIAEARPVQNLRLGRLLNYDAADIAAHWTGPYANEAELGYLCGVEPYAVVPGIGYPSFYWACSNGGGLHLLTTDTGLGTSAWSFAAGTALEVYVR